MKMIAEYLENSLNFERLARDEKDPKLKADLEKQAAAYRKLASNFPAAEPENLTSLHCEPGPAV
jgi:hypothetical protein